MKNTIKKVLCTTLAAVSLSAFVTVPSSVNTPKSGSSLVNVVEADAANKTPYEGYITEGKNYYTRKSAKGGNNIYDNSEIGNKNALYKFKLVTVYEEKNGYGRISSNSEKKPRWVDLSRVHKSRPNEFTICNAGRHGQYNIKHSTFVSRNGNLSEVLICTICGNHWEKSLTKASTQNKSCGKAHTKANSKFNVVIKPSYYSAEIVSKKYYCKKCGKLVTTEKCDNKYTILEVDDFLVNKANAKSINESIRKYVKGMSGIEVLPQDIDTYFLINGENRIV